MSTKMPSSRTFVQYCIYLSFMEGVSSVRGKALRFPTCHNFLKRLRFPVSFRHNNLHNNLTLVSLPN